MSEAVSRTTETHSSRFDTIYRAYAGELTAYARRLTSNPTEAEDWVADAFMRTMAATERGRGPTENVRAYLYAAVRSIRAEHARSNVVHLHRADLGTDHPDLVESDRTDQVVDTAVATSAFKRLPARWQEVLTLTAVEDADLGDAASRLGISKGAAAVLAFRAREGLRTAYLEEWVTTTQRPECLEPRGKLARFVRDQLRGADAATVQAHLDDCEECSTAVLMLRAEAAQMRAVPIWVLLPSASSLMAAGGGAGVSWEALRTFGQHLVQRLRDNPVQSVASATVAAVAASALAVAALGPSGMQETPQAVAPAVRTTSVAALPPAPEPAPPAATTPPPQAPAPVRAPDRPAPKPKSPTADEVAPVEPLPTVPAPVPVATRPPVVAPVPREHPVHETHPGSGTTPPQGPPTTPPVVRPHPAPHPTPPPQLTPSPREPRPPRVTPLPRVTTPTPRTEPSPTPTATPEPPTAETPTTEPPRDSPPHGGPGTVTVVCTVHGSVLGGVADPVCVLVLTD